MDLNHLNLRVVDPERSRAFYKRWFDFREKFVEDEGAVFLTNDDHFLLALFQGDDSRVPPGFHFGFLLDDAEQVKAMHRAMSEGGTAPGELEEWEDYVTFRCPDPDGYEIEVFWEP